MNKYLQIFKISFQQEFVYRLNFIMWRVRNAIQILLVFFLWDTVFESGNRELFGYDRSKILTYIFGLFVIRSIVLSTRSIDMPGEIARGEISNYLLRPISYIKYWFVRDFSSKALNLIFASFEIIVLYFILRPPLFVQHDILYLGFFGLSLILAVMMYFFIVFIFGLPTFWYPEQAWGLMFLLFVFVDLFGGGIFPIDILPFYIQKIFYLTPFPYLLFTPIQLYLGKFDVGTSITVLLMASMWTVVLFFAVKLMWRQGLKTYKAEGR